jgi:hypothetical protein
VGEKRRDPRIPVEDSVSFMSKSGKRHGTVFNLSVGGCAVESGQPVDPNSTIQLDLVIPNEKNPVKVGRARVTWKAGSDMGVEFVNMNSTAKLRLQRYLDSLSHKTQKQGKA